MSNIKEVLQELNELPSFLDVNLENPNVRGSFGDTPLHAAVIQGNSNFVKILLEAGADINAQGEHGYTPLHEAVEQDNYIIAKLLIEHGACQSIKNHNGFTPIELASMVSSTEIQNLFMGIK